MGTASLRWPGDDLLDHELLAVELALDAAAGGRAQLVMVTGGSGAGKTRLAQEAVQLAAHRGFRCAWGSSWPEHMSPPLWPWQAILEQLDERDPRPTSGCAPSASFSAVTSALRRAARRRPLLVVIDDAHTADSSAVALCRHALRSLPAEPVAIIVTCPANPADLGPNRLVLEELADGGVTLDLPALDAGASNEQPAELDAALANRESSVPQRSADDDPVAVAEAALQAGGLLVFEHRTAAGAAEYRERLRRAATQLGSDRPDLRARLRARLEAERFFAGIAAIGDVCAAVAAARQSGDRVVAAEALSLLHNCMLGPRYAHERLALADEICATAEASRVHSLGLMGTLWRAVDLITLGDSRAPRAVAELHTQADAAGADVVRYAAALMDVMVLLRAGRIDEAEAAAESCFQQGVEVGKPDAAAYYGAHVLAIRWLQGRAGELIALANDLVHSPSLVVNDPAFPAVVAALAAERGDIDEAHRQLDALRRESFESLGRSSNALVALFAIVEAARALDDGHLAAEAYAALEPFVDLPVVASLGAICLGPAERLLGVAARVMRDTATAIGHFESALTMAEALDNRPLTAVLMGELALARLDHGDRDESLALADDAARALESLGLDQRARKLRQDVAASMASHASGDRGLIRFLDAGVEVGAGDARVMLPHLVGLHYLAQLVADPGRRFSASALAGASPAADDAARERARIAVLRAIRRLLQRITETCPQLGRSLSASIRTGHTCSFEPTDGAPTRWEIEDHRRPGVARSNVYAMA